MSTNTNISTGRTIGTSLVRPSDTTTYAAGEVVNTTVASVLQFSKAAVGGLATIVSATIIDDANQTTKPDLELWLFSSTVTADADNAVFTPTDAELRTLVGVIAFPVASFKVGDASSGAAGNCICDVQNLNIAFNGASQQTNDLFGVLVVRNAYVPVSGERFDIRLKVRD